MSDDRVWANPTRNWSYTASDWQHIYPTTVDLETASGTNGNMPEISVNVSALVNGFCAAAKTGMPKSAEASSTAMVKSRTVSPLCEYIRRRVYPIAKLRDSLKEFAADCYRRKKASRNKAPNSKSNAAEGQVRRMEPMLHEKHGQSCAVAKLFQHRRDHHRPKANGVRADDKEDQLKGQPSSSEAVIKSRMRDRWRILPAD